jgi:hypothetical protein
MIRDQDALELGVCDSHARLLSVEYLDVEILSMHYLDVKAFARTISEVRP